MTRVVSYKKLKTETETVMNLEDVLTIIKENLGSDVLEVLIEFMKEKVIEKLPNADTFIEGIFQEQIQESDILKKLIKKILENLDEQGYLKKNKKIENFDINEDELIEIIDVELSEGIKNYFGM